MTYTPEQRAADAVIHNAIYGPWDETRCRVCGWPVKEKIRDGCTKDICSMVDREGKRADEPRRFHESHDARAALLEWLKTKDEVLQEKFVCAALRQIGGDLYDRYQVDRGFYADQMIAIMAATPAQVAEAALRVIKEMK